MCCCSAAEEGRGRGKGERKGVVRVGKRVNVRHTHAHAQERSEGAGEEEEEEEEEEEGKEDFKPFDYSSAMQQQAATKFRVGSVTTKQQQKIVRKKRFERKKTEGTGEKLVVQQPKFEGKKRRQNIVKGFSSLSKRV